MANEEYCNQLERRIAEIEKENAELRVQLGLSGTNTTDTVPLAEVENSLIATVQNTALLTKRFNCFVDCLDCNPDNAK